MRDKRAVLSCTSRGRSLPGARTEPVGAHNPEHAGRFSRRVSRRNRHRTRLPRADERRGEPRRPEALRLQGRGRIRLLHGRLHRELHHRQAAAVERRTLRHAALLRIPVQPRSGHKPPVGRHRHRRCIRNRLDGRIHAPLRGAAQIRSRGIHDVLQQREHAPESETVCTAVFVLLLRRLHRAGTRHKYGRRHISVGTRSRADGSRHGLRLARGDRKGSILRPQGDAVRNRRRDSRRFRGL